MNKINKWNLKGVTAESVTGVIILFIALINSVLQIIGINALPIENTEVSNIISIVFLIITTLYNTYKNRNVSSAAQIAQEITNSIKNGEILIEDAMELVNKVKRDYKEGK